MSLLRLFLPILLLLGFEFMWLPVSGRTGTVKEGRLSAAATAHAQDLCQMYTVERQERAGRTLHEGSDGSYPHERVRRAGYALPDSYPAHDNWIESVAVDHRGPAAALQILLDSPSHYDHITGQGFFAGQTHYGIGIACGAYYVLITAPPERGAGR